MGEGIHAIARFLIIAGVVIAAAGAVLLVAGKIPWVGRLPGDIVVQRKNFTFFFPIVTSILLSILITFILWLLGRK